jgi:hypothetical protein
MIEQLKLGNIQSFSSRCDWGRGLNLDCIEYRIGRWAIKLDQRLSACRNSGNLESKLEGSRGRLFGGLRRPSDPLGRIFRPTERIYHARAHFLGRRRAGNARRRRRLVGRRRPLWPLFEAFGGPRAGLERPECRRDTVQRQTLLMLGECD